MCEFKVFLNGSKVMEDVVIAKYESGIMILSDVVGESREFKDVRIVEVNVPSTRLVLESF